MVLLLVLPGRGGAFDPFNLFCSIRNPSIKPPDRGGFFTQRCPGHRPWTAGEAGKGGQTQPTNQTAGSGSVGFLIVIYCLQPIFRRKRRFGGKNQDGCAIDVAVCSIRMVGCTMSERSPLTGEESK